MGTGGIAAMHAKAIRSSPQCELVGVHSASSERAQAAEEQFGVAGITDLTQLARQNAVDAVCICTPSGRHLESAREAAALGLHVLCEKPLEINMERAGEMVRICEEAGVKLGCIFQNRFKGDFVKLKAAVTEGKFGKLLLGNAYIKWYRDPSYYSSSVWKGTLQGDGGAALINQGIHTIDLLLDIMGGVEKVFAKTRTLHHNIEGEDIGLAMLTFANGAFGMIEGSTALYPGYAERLEIFGEEGSAILENGNIIEWNIRGEENARVETRDVNNSGSSDPLAIADQFHQLQIADFADAILEDRDPLVTGVDSLSALDLIEHIYKSSKENREIVVVS